MTEPASVLPKVCSLIAAIFRLRALCIFCRSGKSAADNTEATVHGWWADQTVDPTIADILSDPIIHAVMAADGVDPHALEAELQAMGRCIVRTRRYE
jgi:hypothetical protein